MEKRGGVPKEVMVLITAYAVECICLLTSHLLEPRTELVPFLTAVITQLVELRFPRPAIPASDPNQHSDHLLGDFVQGALANVAKFFLKGDFASLCRKKNEPSNSGDLGKRTPLATPQGNLGGLRTPTPELASSTRLSQSRALISGGDQREIGPNPIVFESTSSVIRHAGRLKGSHQSVFYPNQRPWHQFEQQD